jgi:hypothetical protein
LITALESLKEQIVKLNDYLGTQQRGQEASVPPDSQPDSSLQQQWENRMDLARKARLRTQRDALTDPATAFLFGLDPEASVLGRIRQYARPTRAQQQQAGSISDTASDVRQQESSDSQQSQMAPQQTQAQQGPSSGQRALSGISSTASVGNMTAPEAMAWEVLGEQGGPSFIRNLALRNYGLQRSLQWSTGVLQNASDYLNEDNPLQAPLQTFQGALNLAQAHPAVTFAAAAGLHAFGNLRDAALSRIQMGEQFGYGAPLGSPGFLGMHTLSLGDAFQVGEAFREEMHALEGRLSALLPGGGGRVGFGLTNQQAQQTMDVLASQGFAMAPDVTNLHGPAATLAQNFMAPLLRQFPGVSPEDLAQFTSMTRYGAASTKDLVQALGNLGDQARTTNQTVGQVASSLKDVADIANSMGANPVSGVALGRGFTEATGLPAQVAGDLLQNPIMQGLAISRYGILPSGLAQMNPGSFAGLSLSALQMMQRATMGFNRPVYGTVWGHRVLEETGQQAQDAQIANLFHLPYQYVQRMLGHQGQIQATSNLETLQQDMQRRFNQGQSLQADWNVVSQHWRQAGITAQEWQRLQGESGQKRINDLRDILTNIQQRHGANKIQTGDATLQVQFTGAAARWFEQHGKGPSLAKLASNAAQGPAMNSIINSALGDPNIVGRFGSMGYGPPGGP